VGGGCAHRLQRRAAVLETMKAVLTHAIRRGGKAWWRCCLLSEPDDARQHSRAVARQRLAPLNQPSIWTKSSGRVACVARYLPMVASVAAPQNCLLSLTIRVSENNVDQDTVGPAVRQFGGPSASTSRTSSRVCRRSGARELPSTTRAQYGGVLLCVRPDAHLRQFPLGQAAWRRAARQTKQTAFTTRRRRRRR
jgi:hypothetical protein